MQSTNCLNCGAVVTSEQKFCSNCGQKTDIKRLSFYQLFRDLLLFITHAESGLLNLFKGLAVRPGKTAVEYVEGKRKSYFNPFAFVALCIAFSLFIGHWLKTYDDAPEPDAKVLARMPDEKLKNEYILSTHRLARIQNLGNKNYSLLTILVAPYFAFCLWLFYKQRKRNVAEITTAYILFTGFGSVLAAILISPWLALSRHTNAYYYIFFLSLLLQTMYYSWGLKTFFGFRSTASYLGILLVLGLAGLIGFIVLILCLFFYVYRDMRVFNYL